MHEFKKCAPESLLDNVAFFSTKCVDFKADYKAASMGKKLTYKFKVLAKKMHHKTSEFDADFGAVVDGGNDLVLMGSDADSSENEFKQISSDRKITKELSKKWSERWNVLKKKSASPKSKFIFVEQDVVVIKRPLVPWPFANDDGVWPPSSPNTVGSVAHNLQTYGKPYIHGGFDIRTSSNASCHSPVAGRIVKIVKYQESDLYYSVMILDEFDFIWQFHHLDPNTFTVKEGDFIKQGHVIGKVAFWPDIMNGVNYHHTHMNIVRAKSSWKVKKGYPNPYVPGWIYYNPFSFFNHGNKYKNTIEPSSESRLYLFSDRSKPALAEISHIENVELARIAGPVVKGTIHAVTHLATEFSSSNAIPGGAPYIQCPHEIIWFVSKRTPSSLGGSGNGGKLPRGDDALDFIMKKYQIVNGPNVVGRFDRLPPAQWPRKADSHDPKPLSDLFKYEFKNSTGGTVVSRFDYDVRTAYYSITNTVRGEIGSGEGSGWNTKSVKDGSYVIHVMARDWWGEWGHWKYPVTVNN